MLYVQVLLITLNKHAIIKTNNKILMATRYLCYEYWKRNDSMVDYFLLHNFMSIVLEYYSEDWKKIIPKDNATPHELLLRLFEEYDERIWNAIKGQASFHKLSYKFDVEYIYIKNTYYEVIFKIVYEYRRHRLSLLEKCFYSDEKQ